MLRDKLNRLSSQIVRPQPSSVNSRKDDRYLRAAEALQGEIISSSDGTFLEIVTDFEATYSHGRSTFYELSQPTDLRKGYFLNARVNEMIDREKLLFFDMETTGLSGGSGTVPFLIGCGSMVDERFQVRQYFLPDYPDEAAMLEAVRAEISDETIIVSYNGKSFDLPILVDRLILHRIERNLKIADHIDLLHPVRKLYKRRLKDCTLGNVERSILEFFRYDDIPGYLVPAVYFNWLATQETGELARVVRHNLNDIVSLYFILYHIADILENPSARIKEPEDVYSLARLLEKKGDHEGLCRLIEDFHALLWDEGRHDILFFHSLSYKRNGVFLRAVEIWKKISITDSPEAFFAGIELAKFYEHRARDISRALQHAVQAEKRCPRHRGLTLELEKRIGRLKRKLSS
ncbi:MAG: ribonuclease H-like domain-containing protein [candidate division Zixibacteria bacterium]|nr:ribonuclease H-like domain-containing protein [candidate division Zixibacteria bacterium]